MADSYRICLILPQNYPHSLCFREVGLSILSALKSNGLECDLTFNQLAPEKINIILGYHLMTFSDRLKTYRYIPYQLEQLHSREFPFSKNMESILRNALAVWDYSEKNIAFLKELGINAKKLPPGYHENLELIPPAPTQNIDILFYGSMGERRKKVLEILDNRCKLKLLFGVYGEKRDKWISRAKIILNMHHYSRQIFEAVRVSYLLNNRCFVISEQAIDFCFPKVNLIMVSYDSLIDTCMEFLKNPEKRDSIRQQNHEEFKKHYPMSELIKEVL